MKIAQASVFSLSEKLNFQKKTIKREVVSLFRNLHFL